MNHTFTKQCGCLSTESNLSTCHLPETVMATGFLRRISGHARCCNFVLRLSRALRAPTSLLLQEKLQRDCMKLYTK